MPASDDTLRLIELTEKIAHLDEIKDIALEAARVGYWCWYLDTNKIFWSQSMYVLFGVDSDTFKGTYEDFINLLHPSDVEAVTQQLNYVVNNGIPYDANYRVRSHGKWKIIKGRGDLMYTPDGKRCVAGICIGLNNVATPSVVHTIEELLKPVKV